MTKPTAMSQSAQVAMLGVNVDHIATVRQARGSQYPDPVHAALAAEMAGADGITVHLREDRRHIQEHDVTRLLALAQTRVNLEMAVTEPMLSFAEQWQPPLVCLVPEKREELTTEGGLDVAGQLARMRRAVTRLADAGCEVSLFIDPDEAQVMAAVEVGAPVIELHTGAYAEGNGEQQRAELFRLEQAAKLAQEVGLIVNAGHGLHYHNVQPVAAIAGMNELNIGHAIIARALFAGIDLAVRDMKQLLLTARQPVVV